MLVCTLSMTVWRDKNLTKQYQCSKSIGHFRTVQEQKKQSRVWEDKCVFFFSCVKEIAKYSSQPCLCSYTVRMWPMGSWSVCVMDAFAFKKPVAVRYYASFLHSKLLRASMTRQTQLLDWQNLLSRILISFSSAPLDVIKETNLWTRHLPRLYFLPDWVRNPSRNLQRSIALWRWFLYLCLLYTSDAADE